jgi:hypothetical protein
MALNLSDLRSGDNHEARSEMCRFDHPRQREAGEGREADPEVSDIVAVHRPPDGEEGDSGDGCEKTASPERDAMQCVHIAPYNFRIRFSMPDRIERCANFSAPPSITLAMP